MRRGRSEGAERTTRNEDEPCPPRLHDTSAISDEEEEGEKGSPPYNAVSAGSVTARQQNLIRGGDLSISEVTGMNPLQTQPPPATMS